MTFSLCEHHMLPFFGYIKIEYHPDEIILGLSKFSRIVDFYSKKLQTQNEQLINVRETFDQYNLISALHSFLAVRDEKFKNILPPLVLLSREKQKELIDKLNNLKFISKKI